MKDSQTIGVISDTHGLLRPKAIEALQGSDFIIHAGDIGSPDILEQLSEIAPVTVVRGNVDKADWAQKLPSTEVLEVGTHLLYILHILDDLYLDPEAAEFSAVIFGHSHQPHIEQRGKVLYLNPGSAGPKRFNLPITVAKIQVTHEGLFPEIIHIST